MELSVSWALIVKEPFLDMLLHNFHNYSIKSYHYSPSKELNNLSKVTVNWSDTKSIILSIHCDNIKASLWVSCSKEQTEESWGLTDFRIKILQDDSHGAREWLQSRENFVAP